MFRIQQALPFSVNRYFCKRLLGLSGKVYSINPFQARGADAVLIHVNIGRLRASNTLLWLRIRFAGSQNIHKFGHF